MKDLINKLPNLIPFSFSSWKLHLSETPSQIHQPILHHGSQSPHRPYLPLQAGRHWRAHRLVLGKFSPIPLTSKTDPLPARALPPLLRLRSRQLLHHCSLAPRRCRAPGPLLGRLLQGRCLGSRVPPHQVLRLGEHKGALRLCRRPRRARFRRHLLLRRSRTRVRPG